MKYKFSQVYDECVDEGLKMDIREFEGFISEFESELLPESPDHIAAEIYKRECTSQPEFLGHVMTIRLWDNHDKFLGIYNASAIVEPAFSIVDVFDEYRNHEHEE